jgi:hypothetical protein
MECAELFLEGEVSILDRKDQVGIGVVENAIQPLIDLAVAIGKKVGTGPKHCCGDKLGYCLCIGLKLGFIETKVPPPVTKRSIKDELQPLVVLVYHVAPTYSNPQTVPPIISFGQRLYSTVPSPSPLSAALSFAGAVPSPPTAGERYLHRSAAPLQTSWRLGDWLCSCSLVPRESYQVS